MITFHINVEKLLEKYKTIWTNIDDIASIKLNTLSVYDGRSIKNK